jgi:hypothetical protein
VAISLAPEDVSFLGRVLIFVGGAIVGFFVGVILLAVWFIGRAPYEQRDEARAELTSRREIHDLLELDKQLRAIREANSRLLGEVKERGLSGSLGADDDPWVRDQNENLGLWLESNGFPDLVSELVVREPKLGTWEGVMETAREIDTNLTRVLEGERLADVRLLRESVKAETKEEPDLPSSRLLALYEEGVALKKGAATPDSEDAVVDRLAARANAVAGWSREVEGVIKNVAPEFESEWNKKRREASSNPSRSDLDERLVLLDGMISRLRARNA